MYAFYNVEEDDASNQAFYARCRVFVLNWDVCIRTLIFDPRVHTRTLLRQKEENVHGSAG